MTLASVGEFLCCCKGTIAFGIRSGDHNLALLRSSSDRCKHWDFFPVGDQIHLGELSDAESRGQFDQFCLSSSHRRSGCCFVNMNSLKLNSEENVGRCRAACNSSDLASSNLSQFLEYTMPTVPVQHLSKNCIWDGSAKRCPSTDADSIPFFYLSDLWETFNEWSAYGAGVPLVLNGEQTVVQYYVPYLSAMQLYVRSAARPQLRFRKLGEESDISDSDFRDTSSETSSDGESETVRATRRCRTSWCTSQTSSSLRRSSSCSLLDEERCEAENRGELLFEYFEHAVPYSRVPLLDKISSLARQTPELSTLRSLDLLPTSWMSIAWYPIYRIPTGPTLQDLAACFLTFHSLSTPLEGGSQQYEKGSHQNGLRSDKYVLPSFGLGSYKLRGAFWTSVGNLERRLASDLQNSAGYWLKDLRVRHPDFEFFMSHNNRV